MSDHLKGLPSPALIVLFVVLSSFSVGEPLSGDRRRARDPLEQRARPGLAPPSGRARRGHVLGVLLPKAELRRRVEQRGALRAPQVLAGAGLPHRSVAAAPPGVPGPPSNALQGKEMLLRQSLIWRLNRVMLLLKRNAKKEQ